MQVNHPSAARAGRAGDRGCSPRRRACRSVAGRLAPAPSAAGSGEQIRAILQRPGQAAPLPGLRCRLRRRRGDHLGRQCGICLRDHVDDQRGRVAPVIGRALRTPRPSVAIAAADPSQLPTGRTRSHGEGRRPRSTSAHHDVGPCAAICRTRRTPAPKSPLPQPCSARSADQRPHAGAGERPSPNTAGRSHSAWASWRRLARPPDTASTTPVTMRRSNPGWPAKHQIDDDADRIGNHRGRQ